MDYLPSRILNYSPPLCGLAIKFVIAAGDLSATDRLTYDLFFFCRLNDFFLSLGALLFCVVVNICYLGIYK